MTKILILLIQNLLLIQLAEKFGLLLNAKRWSLTLQEFLGQQQKQCILRSQDTNCEFHWGCKEKELARMQLSALIFSTWEKFTCIPFIDIKSIWSTKEKLMFLSDWSEINKLILFLIGFFSYSFFLHYWTKKNRFSFSPESGKLCLSDESSTVINIDFVPNSVGPFSCTFSWEIEVYFFFNSRIYQTKIKTNKHFHSLFFRELTIHWLSH